MLVLIYQLILRPDWLAVRFTAATFAKHRCSGPAVLVGAASCQYLTALQSHGPGVFQEAPRQWGYNTDMGLHSQVYREEGGPGDGRHGGLCLSGDLQCQGCHCPCLEAKHHLCGCHGKLGSLCALIEPYQTLHFIIKQRCEAISSLSEGLLIIYYALDPGQGTGATVGWRVPDLQKLQSEG